MYQQALNHFKKVDPILYNAGKDLTIPEPEKSDDYFVSLCREIVGQQLSGKVARVIYARFVNLYPNKKITPEYTLKIPKDTLRNVGMSWGKVSFVKDLAEKVNTKDLKSGYDKLANFS